MPDLQSELARLSLQNLKFDDDHDEHSTQPLDGTGKAEVQPGPNYVNQDNPPPALAAPSASAEPNEKKHTIMSEGYVGRFHKVKFPDMAGRNKREQLFDFIKANPGLSATELYGLLRDRQQLSDTSNLAGPLVEFTRKGVLKREKGVEISRGRTAFLYYAAMDNYKSPDPAEILPAARAIARERARQRKLEQARQAQREAARAERQRRLQERQEREQQKPVVAPVVAPVAPVAAPAPAAPVSVESFVDSLSFGAARAIYLVLKQRFGG